MELRIDPVADQDIVSALRGGNRRQAALLMIKYYGQAIHALCLDRAAMSSAEDLTVECFSAALAKLDELHGDLSVHDWLITVAVKRLDLEQVGGRSDRDDDPRRMSASLRRRLEVLAAAL